MSDKVQGGAGPQTADTTIMASISCVTFNHVNYIRTALDSFLMQETDFAFEILVHDDASTDGTSDIIREYAARYPDQVKPLINQFGVSVAAASGVGLKINTFAGMPCWAIGQAVTAMAGQNIGAGDTKRVRKTTKTGLCLNLLITLTMVLLVQVFGEQLILLFTPASPEMTTEGILYLRICCSVNSLVYAAMYTFDSFAIGIGSANIAMINALLDAVIVRLPVSWLLAFPCGLGFPGVYIGQALSPLLPAVVGLLYFKSKGWENKRINPPL